MKHIFVFNSFSLRKRLKNYVEVIKESAEELKLDYIIEINSDNNSTEDILKKYKKKLENVYWNLRLLTVKMRRKAINSVPLSLIEKISANAKIRLKHL